MSTLLKALAAQQRPRRTALPAAAYERLMVCTACGENVAVFEATLGARTDAEHRWLEPDTYVCGECVAA